MPAVPDGNGVLFVLLSTLGLIVRLVIVLVLSLSFVNAEGLQIFLLEIDAFIDICCEVH